MQFVAVTTVIGAAVFRKVKERIKAMREAIREDLKWLIVLKVGS